MTYRSLQRHLKKLKPEELRAEIIRLQREIDRIAGNTSRLHRERQDCFYRGFQEAESARRLLAAQILQVSRRTEMQRKLAKLTRQKITHLTALMFWRDSISEFIDRRLLWAVARYSADIDARAGPDAQDREFPIVLLWVDVDAWVKAGDNLDAKTDLL